VRTETADLDSLSSARSYQQVVESYPQRCIIGWDPEVRPVNMRVRPRRFPAMVQIATEVPDRFAAVWVGFVERHCGDLATVGKHHLAEVAMDFPLSMFVIGITALGLVVCAPGNPAFHADDHRPDLKHDGERSRSRVAVRR
jgi:hypothetical protein